MKTMLGHDGPPQGYWTENLITDDPLARCPVRSLQLAPSALTTEVLRYVNSYYPAYEDGHLLVAGGLSDQPARYVALVRLTRAYDQLVQAKYDALTAEEGA